MTESDKIRLIAMYLPQFHPIPENDEWWGKGFTEWTNVAKARPLFPGHAQPHLPADLGFYDLRLPETRQSQADLARQYGIHGFCYYHYWFTGRQVLERPLLEVVRSGQPDFPFCVCWANENWTRRWDGKDEEILLAQTYGEDDHRRHLETLAPILADRRYIRVDGKALVLVYRASYIPEPEKTTAFWRDEARRQGIGELYLCNVESMEAEHGFSRKAGYDAAVEFAPDWRRLGPRLFRPLRWASRLGLAGRGYSANRISDYRVLAQNMLAKPDPGYLRYRCVTPQWDNAARRRQDAVILQNSSPDEYETWLRATIERFEPPTPEENFVFVNAWNEWAEGNHLEPCARWGRGYLEATQRALRRTS